MTKEMKLILIAAAALFVSVSAISVINLLNNRKTNRHIKNQRETFSEVFDDLEDSLSKIKQEEKEFIETAKKEREKLSEMAENYKQIQIPDNDTTSESPDSEKNQSEE